MFKSSFWEELKNALNQSYSNSSQQEAILWFLLLLTYELNESVCERKILDFMMKSAVNLLTPLLLNKSTHIMLETELKSLLSNASEVWNRTRKSSDWVLASIEDKDWVWKSYDKYEIRVQLTTQQSMLILSSATSVMTLFPWVYSHNDTTTSFHHEYSLWSDQDLVINDDLESRDQATRVKSKNVKMNGESERWRQSISTSSEAEVLHQWKESIMSSSRSSMMGNRSFLERTDQSDSIRVLSINFGDEHWDLSRSSSDVIVESNGFF
jgi:hypothetical protein